MAHRNNGRELKHGENGISSISRQQRQSVIAACVSASSKHQRRSEAATKYQRRKYREK